MSNVIPCVDMKGGCLPQAEWPYIQLHGASVRERESGRSLSWGLTGGNIEEE